MTRGLVRDVRTACTKKHRLAMLLGALIGGFVPVAIFFTAHHGGFVWQSESGGLVAGGLLYSVQTVYQWARQAFGQALKSVGFVVLLEGVMVTTHIGWLAVTALVYLVVINGVSAGVTISLGSKT